MYVILSLLLHRIRPGQDLRPRDALTHREAAGVKDAVCPLPKGQRGTAARDAFASHVHVWPNI